MNNQRDRLALDQHWAASASGDLETEHNIYDDAKPFEAPAWRSQWVEHAA